jgi:hypothetical protein
MASATVPSAVAPEAAAGVPFTPAPRSEPVLANRAASLIGRSSRGEPESVPDGPQEPGDATPVPDDLHRPGHAGPVPDDQHWPGDATQEPDDRQGSSNARPLDRPYEGQGDPTGRADQPLAEADPGAEPPGGGPARPFEPAREQPSAEAAPTDRGTAATGPETYGEHVGRPVANGFERDSGRHRSDVAMADLLAEALFAYQHGRRSRPSAGPGQAQEQQRPTADPPVPPVAPAGTPEPPVEAERRPRVRWTDLPRELVWREPGWEQRR